MNSGLQRVRLGAAVIRFGEFLSAGDDGLFGGGHERREFLQIGFDESLTQRTLPSVVHKSPAGMPGREEKPHYSGISGVFLSTRVTRRLNGGSFSGWPILRAFRE